MQLAPGRNQHSLTVTEGLCQTCPYIHKISRPGSKLITIPSKSVSTDPPVLHVTVRDAQRGYRNYVQNIYKLQPLTLGIKALQVFKQTHI